MGRHKTCPYIWSIPVRATVVVAMLPPVGWVEPTAKSNPQSTEPAVFCKRDVFEFSNRIKFLVAVRVAPLGLMLRAIEDFIIDLMIEDSYASTIRCDCPVFALKSACRFDTIMAIALCRHCN